MLGYMVLASTNRGKILIKARRRDMNFEEGIKNERMLKRKGNERRRGKELQGKRRRNDKEQSSLEKGGRYTCSVGTNNKGKTGARTRAI